VIRVYDEAGNVIETHGHTRASSKSGESIRAISVIGGFSQKEKRLDILLNRPSTYQQPIYEKTN
jgi:hypothetical protein